MTLTGTVVYQDIEGGFWGIKGDDNMNYEPADPLPRSVCKPHARVEVNLQPLNVLSAKMWGVPVRVLSIRAI